MWWPSSGFWQLEIAARQGFCQVGENFSLTISVSIPLHRDVASKGWRENLKQQLLYRAVGRLTESNQRGWIPQKSAQWEVVPTLGVKGWKQGRRSVSGAWEHWSCHPRGTTADTRMLGGSTPDRPTLCPPSHPLLSTSASLDHPELGREGWPQQMGKKQDHWRDRLNKDSLATETWLPPELFTSLPTFLPNQSRNSILGKRFLTHARLLDKRFVPYCMPPIFCAIQEEALFVLEKPRTVSSQHLTVTSFWVDSVKSVPLEFGELSQRSPEKGDWIHSLLYL